MTGISTPSGLYSIHAGNHFSFFGSGKQARVTFIIMVKIGLNGSYAVLASLCILQNIVNVFFGLLGFSSTQDSLLYPTSARLCYPCGGEDCTGKVAKTQAEKLQLIEAGFEFVSPDPDGTQYFRKRKKIPEKVYHMEKSMVKVLRFGRAERLQSSKQLEGERSLSQLLSRRSVSPPYLQSLSSQSC